jgi:hypothetical protein
MHPLPLLLLALCPAVLAQSAQTLALPDLLDFRRPDARLASRLRELADEASLQAAPNPALAGQIQSIRSSLLAQSLGQQAIAPSSSVEMHIVSFYEGFGATSTTPGTANVHVNRPGSAVALILNAYDPIAWNITVDPATALVAVISYSYEPQTISGTGNALTLQLSYTNNNDGDYFGAPNDDTDPEARFRAFRWVWESFGSLPNTFIGDYTAPAGSLEVGSGNPDWATAYLANEAATASLIFCGGTRARLQSFFRGASFLPLLTPAFGQPGAPTVVLATPLGIERQLVTLQPRTTDIAIGNLPMVFSLHNGRPSLLDLTTFTSSPLPTSPNVTPFSSVGAISFDSNRNRLWVSSRGGGGVMYQFDPTSFQWTELANPNPEGPSAMAFHPTYDAHFGLRVDRYETQPNILNRYDLQGNIATTVIPGLPCPDDFLDQHRLLPLGNALVYVGPARSIFSITFRHCYVIDPLSGDVLYASFLVGS